MRWRVGVGKCDNRGDALPEFLTREILGSFGGQDQCADLSAATAEDDGISDVGGGAKSELDRDRVGLFAVDLLGFEW